MGSDFLFSKPTFLEGVARIFDFSNALESYNTSSTGEEADLRALENDVATIRADFQIVLDKYLNSAEGNELVLKMGTTGLQGLEQQIIQLEERIRRLKEAKRLALQSNSENQDVVEGRA